MSDPILPLAVWASGTNENSIPANDNALRVEAMSREVISKGVTTQPGSPEDGAVYIIPPGASGAQWSLFDADDIAIYRDGNWYAWAPVDGIVVNIAGSMEDYSGSSGWSSIGGGGGGSTQGKQAIYIAAGAMRPSFTGGCQALSLIATSANQPDILTLDFDFTVDEFAQFSFVMPKKWNEGNITCKFHWSHSVTTVNFGVAWALQAVAVGNDDAIPTAYGTAVSTVDTGGTTDDLYITSESSSITVGGSPGPEEMVFFRVYRDTANGGDNMGIDARLHGITLYVTTNADTDA